MSQWLESLEQGGLVIYGRQPDLIDDPLDQRCQKGPFGIAAPPLEQADFDDGVSGAPIRQA